MTAQRLFFTLTLTLTTTLPLAADDWPQFRGPNSTGVSKESGLPVGFTDSAGLRWKAALPGRGLASPVIVGSRVYVIAGTGVNDDRLHVMCFDAGTGAKLWQRQLAATGSTNCHPTTCMAAPTPAADESGVYALFATGDLAAFSPDGTLRWYRSLVGDYPTITNQVGMASSPVLADGKLIIPMDNAGESFLAAIDTKTGKNLWKIERPREINWTTPVARIIGGKTELLFQGPKDLTAYDSATGGKVWSAKMGGSIPSATVVGESLLIPANGVTLAKLDTSGPTEVWKAARMQTGYTSPLYYDGIVYAANPRAGIMSAVDAKTGTALWQERVRGPFSGSPIGGDGKIYLVSDAGELTVFKAGDKAEILGQTPLKDKVQSTPAISGGALFIRGEKTLFCIGSKLGG